MMIKIENDMVKPNKVCMYVCLSSLNSNDMRLFNIGKIDFRVMSCFVPGRRTVEGGRRVLALLHPRLPRLTQRHQLSDGLRTVGACK